MSVDEKIVEVVREAETALTPKEIAKRGDLTHSYVRKLVRDLAEEEILEDLGGGQYALFSPLEKAKIEILSRPSFSVNPPAKSDKVQSLVRGKVVRVSQKMLGGLPSTPASDAGENPVADPVWVGAEIETTEGFSYWPKETWAIAKRISKVGKEGYYLTYQWQPSGQDRTGSASGNEIAVKASVGSKEISRKEAASEGAFEQGNSRKEAIPAGEREKFEGERTGVYRSAYLHPSGEEERVVEELGPEGSFRSWRQEDGKVFTLDSFPNPSPKLFVIGSIRRVLLDAEKQLRCSGGT